MDIPFAYLAENKVYMKPADGPPKLVESAFAQGVIDREMRERSRNQWKSSGASAAFQRGAMPWATRDDDPSARRVRMTALASGAPGELVYTLNTAAVGGLFVHELSTAYEQRVFHRNGLHVRNLGRRTSDGSLALSLQLEDGTANIATIDAKGRGLREVTEGDSVDESPAWMPGERKRIVFQSAGVARNARGHVAAIGPYAVQQLDLENGELTTLIENEKTDYLCPKPAADGSLYYIRRPWRAEHGSVNPLKLAGDILLFPLRLARALVHFANFFSMMFSGKPLLTAGGPKNEGIDQKHLMLWGKLVDADKAMKAAKEGESPSLVPPEWELVRRSAHGREEVLVKGVLSFDLAANGRVLYTNGTGVFELQPDGASRKLCEGKMIEQLASVD